MNEEIEALKIQLKDVKSDVEDANIGRFHDVDQLQAAHKHFIKTLNEEHARQILNYKEETDRLREEVSVLKKILQNSEREKFVPSPQKSSTSEAPLSTALSSSSRKVPTEDKQNPKDTKKAKVAVEEPVEKDPPGNEQDEEEGEEEEEEENDETYDYGGDEEDYEDKEPDKGTSSDESKDMQRMFELFMKMAKAGGTVEGDGAKSKEADTIRLPQLPTAAQFKSWKNIVRSRVSSASKIPKEAFEWIRMVEDDNVTYEMLNETPAKFETLDAKLCAALSEVCKGEIGRKITLKTEEEAKARRLIRGRQVLWMIYEDFRINEEAGALHDITDLMKVTLKRDQTKIENLSRFLLNWEMILAGMKDPPPENTLQVMLYDQVRNVTALATDIAVYDRATPGTEERSYNFLMKAIKRVLERHRQEKNRRDIEKSLDHLTSKGNVNAFKGAKGGGKGPKGGGKGKGKGEGKGPKGDNTCRQWMSSQECSRGASCKYDHPPMNGWKFVAGAEAKAKAKPKAKSKPEANANVRKEKPICKLLAKTGTCKYGDKCRDDHDIPMLAPVASEKPKPKSQAAKAKAAAKADSSGN
jgi:hypothetical protein